MCLIARGINAGIIYHSPRFQCIPPSVQLWQPTIYNIPGRILCANTCSQKRCFFYEVSATNGPCKIYGIGMESTNYYVRIDAATLPPGGPLQEKARYRPTYPLSSLALSSNAVDDDVPSFWENGLLNPWWMVDLGAYYMIHYVNILPRQGYYTYRFQSVEVRAGPQLKTDGNLTQWELVGFYPGVYAGGNARIQFNNTQGVCGRFLSVQRNNSLNDVLALADVLVYVRKSPYN
ncbi:uncharacterized protein LOC135207566 isoform X2 [Macrobrachium nipponense]|uniref:uncharacterized protein LOC135207566 isoform X2 n=1 Tax=Macrobrachium nipponense TaxID=159736 RepID=UPI0030C8498E